MNRILIITITVSVMVLSFCGCKEKLPPASSEKAALLEIQMTCSSCRKVCSVKECKRINQVLFNCPHCNRVINISKARQK